jgi:hypothetical protein
MHFPRIPAPSHHKGVFLIIECPTTMTLRAAPPIPPRSLRQLLQPLDKHSTSFYDVHGLWVLPLLRYLQDEPRALLWQAQTPPAESATESGKTTKKPVRRYSSLPRAPSLYGRPPDHLAPLCSNPKHNPHAIIRRGLQLSARPLGEPYLFPGKAHIHKKGVDGQCMGQELGLVCVGAHSHLPHGWDDS